jgi:hypothetical protein
MKILRGEENKILPLAKTVHYICYINIKKGEKAVVLFSSGDGVPVASRPRGRGVRSAGAEPDRGRGIRVDVRTSHILNRSKRYIQGSVCCA